VKSEVEEWIRVLGFEFGGREGECVNKSVCHSCESDY